jgi:hypothetical protein
MLSQILSTTFYFWKILSVRVIAIAALRFGGVPGGRDVGMQGQTDGENRQTWAAEGRRKGCPAWNRLVTAKTGEALQGAVVAVGHYGGRHVLG